MPYSKPEERNRQLAAKRQDPEWRERENQKKRDWYAKHRTRISAERKAEREVMTPEQKAQEAAYQLQYYHSRPELKEKQRIRRKETLAKRDQLADRPKPDRCENCGSRELIRWHHDHATGKFVAWLCHSCNVIEGHAHGRPEVLEGIARLMRGGFVEPGNSFHGELAMAYVG